jgi:hypothetical protein
MLISASDCAGEPEFVILSATTLHSGCHDGRSAKDL